MDGPKNLQLFLNFGISVNRAEPQCMAVNAFREFGNLNVWFLLLVVSYGGVLKINLCILLKIGDDYITKVYFILE